MSESQRAVVRYLSYCRNSRRLSALTIRAYEADLEQFCQLLVGQALDASSALNALKRVAENPTYKVTTVKRKLSVCRAFLQHSYEEIADQVRKGWKLRLRAPTRLPKAIPRNKLNGILRCARGAHMGKSSTTHLALSILAATGLRISELCSTRLSDVNLETGEIKVFGKGARERIVVVVNSRVRATLASHVQRRVKIAGAKAALFCNSRGRPLSPQCLRLRLHKLAKEAGIFDRVTPHMFRHSAATLLLEEGVDIRFVQRLLGHASISTTEIYTHVADKALRTALERADVMRGLV